MKYILFALFVLIILACLLQLAGSVLTLVATLMEAEPIVLIALGALFVIALGIAIFVVGSASNHTYHSHW